MERKKRRANANLPHWPTSNVYREEVVGESFYVESFNQLTDWGEYTEELLLTMATLVPDPENKHDSNAIKVMVDDRHIGHLSRDSAVICKEKVLENPDIYLPPLTTANIQIRRKIFDGAPAYSASLDLDFSKPPSDQNKLPRRIKRAFKIPPLRSRGCIENGFLIFFSPYMSQYTIDRATAGDWLDVWWPDDSDDIYLYVKGSVGGAGTVVHTDRTGMKAAGFSEDLSDFHPFIHTVAGNIIFSCAEIPSKK